jgi:hypothetical protein
VVPAHERFEAGDAIGGQRRNRLVCEHELAAVERAGKVGLELQLGLRGLQRRPVEHLAAAAAQVPGALHRHVGVAQHLVGTVIAGGADGDADARGQPQFAGGVGKREPQLGQDAIGRDDGVPDLP